MNLEFYVGIKEESFPNIRKNDFDNWHQQFKNDPCTSQNWKWILKE